MTKESWCNLIGWEHISVWNFKLCVSKQVKTLLFHSKSINISFRINFNLTMHFRSARGIYWKSIQGWVLLGYAWLCPTKSINLKISLHWWLSLCKKSKTLIDFIQRFDDQRMLQYDWIAGYFGLTSKILCITSRKKKVMVE